MLHSSVRARSCVTLHDRIHVKIQVIFWWTEICSFDVYFILWTLHSLTTWQKLSPQTTYSFAFSIWQVAQRLFTYFANRYFVSWKFPVIKWWSHSDSHERAPYNEIIFILWHYLVTWLWPGLFILDLSFLYIRILFNSSWRVNLYILLDIRPLIWFPALLSWSTDGDLSEKPANCQVMRYDFSFAHDGFANFKLFWRIHST